MADQYLLTIPEAAKRLSICESITRRMIRSGELAEVRIGRSVRVSTAAIDRFIEAHQVSGDVV